MAEAKSFIRPVTPTMLAPCFLAAVVLLAPLASGYAWVSGGHAVEGHVHRHHLLEKLVPTAHHHAAPLPSSKDSAADRGYGAAILRGAAAFTLSAVMAPAFLPELATYLDAAADALILAAVAALLLTRFSIAIAFNSRRPQTECSPPERPPTH